MCIAIDDHDLKSIVFFFVFVGAKEYQQHKARAIQTIKQRPIGLHLKEKKTKRNKLVQLASKRALGRSSDHQCQWFFNLFAFVLNVVCIPKPAKKNKPKQKEKSGPNHFCRPIRVRRSHQPHCQPDSLGEHCR